MSSDKSDTSSDESYVSSDESDLSWDDDSSSEESLLEEEDEEEYDPCGAESDDDANECCHWSTSKEVPADQIQLEAGIPVYGGCLSEFDGDFKPHNVVELMIDEKFLDGCIDTTNAHGANDPNFLSKVSILEKNEKGRSFIKGYLAIKWHFGLIKYPNKRWAWSEDPLKTQAKIKKVMTYKTFQVMNKHFAVVHKDQLPLKGTPDYHPLQNISAGVQVLKENVAALWESGSMLCIDEGRVKSKSKRNPYKIRNPEKPIKMGWTIYKIGERGQFVGYAITDHLAKVGRKTYTSTSRGKTHNIVDQLLDPHKGKGKLWVLDNGFPTVKLLEDAKQMWNTKIVATQRGKTAHFPARHQKFMKQTKNFARGFSKSLHHDFLTITYWNDNNAVCFMDNDMDSSRDTWETILVKNRNGGETAVHIPKVASQYRSVYGWVDSCNQQLSYYNTECRSVRKQSRVLDSLMEMYAPANGLTIWSNSNLRSNKMDQSEFRFETIRAWYAEFKKNNGKPDVLHYPVRQPRKRRNVSNVLLSPRKGKKYCYEAFTIRKENRNLIPESEK